VQLSSIWSMQIEAAFEHHVAGTAAAAQLSWPQVVLDTYDVILCDLPHCWTGGQANSS
jgi:hypothetical protein